MKTKCAVLLKFKNAPKVKKVILRLVLCTFQICTASVNPQPVAFLSTELMVIDTSRGGSS